MIKELSTANNVSELYERIPKALNVVGAYRQKLLDNEIPIWDLIIKKHLSKEPRHYRQNVSQVIAARQLQQAGEQVNAGSSLKFLFTDAKNKRPSRRVRAQQLIGETTNPDTRQYLKMLYDSSANLLSFAGFTTRAIFEAVTKQKQAHLELAKF